LLPELEVPLLPVVPLLPLELDPLDREVSEPLAAPIPPDALDPELPVVPEVPETLPAPPEDCMPASAPRALGIVSPRRPCALLEDVSLPEFLQAPVPAISAAEAARVNQVRSVMSNSP
jgi:hypothetical protein